MHIFKILTKKVVAVNKNYIELICFNRFRVVLWLLFI